ncbi:MAG: hypothetical protein ACK52I_22305 [Pseudomonadota bacterium]|jgi:hypothetical protein
MKNLIVIGVIGLVIGVGAWAYRTGQKIANEFTFKPLGFGKPSISKGYLTVPVLIELVNPSPVAINLDGLLIDLYLQKGSQWVKAATVNQAISVPSGVSQQSVFPIINLKQVFGGDLLNTLNTIQQSLSTRSFTIKAEITGRYAGIIIPTQSIAAQTIKV